MNEITEAIIGAASRRIAFWGWKSSKLLQAP